MKKIRNLAAETAGLKEAVVDSLESPKTLLYSLFSRRKLKDEPVCNFHASSDHDIDAFWAEILKVDETLTRVTQLSSKSCRRKSCKTSSTAIASGGITYMFKCEDATCSVCKPPRLPQDVFQSLHHLPDPVPNADHYKEFSVLYGTETS